MVPSSGHQLMQVPSEGSMLAWPMRAYVGGSANCVGMVASLVVQCPILDVGDPVFDVDLVKFLLTAHLPPLEHHSKAP